MDTNSLDIITKMISSLGFPIFVAVWMMIKNSKDTAEVKQAINELTTAIKLLSERNIK